MKAKPRLRGKRPAQLPTPVGKRKEMFSLRVIDEADHRFAIVKRLRRRIDQLVDESGPLTLAREMLAARAAHLAALLESMEVGALEGEEIDYPKYFTATRTLTDVLNKLGLDREAKSTISLQDYLVAKHKKPAKPKSK